MNEIIFEMITNQNNKKAILKDIENQLIKEQIINKENTILRDIDFRELKGSLEIFPKVLLPHIKESYVKQACIVLVKNNAFSMEWENKFLDLIILILLPETPKLDDKKAIRTFMRNLADEIYIKKLIQKE